MTVFKIVPDTTQNVNLKVTSTSQSSEIKVSGFGGPQGTQGIQGIQGIKGRYTVSDTAPLSPTAGDGWFNSTTSQFYIYYDSYWIETSVGYVGPTMDMLNVASNILPSTDNIYTLGSTSKRWKDIYVGPGTINITDSVLSSIAAISVANGIFNINGIAQAQLPNVKITNLTFNDNTVQTTAYVPGNVAIRTPATGNTLTVNLATDTYVHQHINSGNLNITLTNPTAGRTIELLLMWGNASGGSISINGISGSNISNGSNGFAITKQFNSIRIYCIDNNFTETFAVVSTS